MKKLLSILSVLCLTVSGFAQTLTPVQFYIREAGTTTNLYQVTAVRNESTYPYTSKGNSDFLAAVSAGSIQRVTSDGCIIPVGQKAPIQKPTCGTENTTAPSWITGLRYRYESPQKLRFEAKGSISQAKFARADGQSFSILNPDNIPIENDKYYGYGGISGDANGYDKQWQINIPAVALKVTFQKSGSSDTYTTQLIPSLSAGTVQLIATSTAPGSTTTTTPDSPTSVQPENVYAYKGDNFAYIPLPSSSTDDKFPVFENEYGKFNLALRDQSQSSQQPGMGGAVYQLYNKQHNANHTLLYNANRYNGDDNNAVDRNRTPDRIFLGQGLTNCEYAGPRPFFTNTTDGAAGSSYLVNGQKPGGTDGYLGFNPNEAGDDLMNSARLLVYGRSGNSFYTKAAVPIYGQNGYYPPNNGVIMEKWGTLNGRALELNYQSTYNRTYTGRRVTKGQETPTLYGNGFPVFKWYDGDTPYASDNNTTVQVERGPNNKNGEGKNGPRINPLYLSEPLIWMGGTDGYGMGLITKDNSTVRYAFYGDYGFDAGNPTMGGTYSSVGASPEEIIDNKIIWRHRAAVVWGTYEECRAYLYATYRPESTPKYKFNVAGRHGWAMNSGDEPEQPGGPEQINTWDDAFNFLPRQGWKVYFSATADAEIYSPGVSWEANKFKKIYVRYKYKGKQTQWRMDFQRNRQISGSFDPNSRFKDEEAFVYKNGTSGRDQQRVYFEMTGDEQWRTAVIDLSNVGAWQGVINRIKFKPHVNASSYDAGEYCIIDWINTVDADPGNN